MCQYPGKESSSMAHLVQGVGQTYSQRHTQYQNYHSFNDFFHSYPTISITFGYTNTQQLLALDLTVETRRRV